MGNLASVAKSLERAGAQVQLSEVPETLRNAGALVLPGVGAFRDAAARLEQLGLDEVIRERIAAGVPFFGVCLGMQLLFERSSEGGDWRGLGVFAGPVERLRTKLKVPHIGWNELEWREAGAGMASGLPAPAHVYFVHSYAAHPADPSVVAAVADHGVEVVAAVAREAVWAMQFHPEKSSAVGLHILGNWVAMAAGVRPAARGGGPPSSAASSSAGPPPAAG